MKEAFLLALAAGSLAGCGSAWTARACTAYDSSGNCKGVDTLASVSYEAKSASIGPVTGLTDVTVRDPRCQTNGIGAIDVKVVDRGDLQLTMYCLPDRPNGAMTLTPADAGAPSSRDGGT